MRILRFFEIIKTHKKKTAFAVIASPFVYRYFEKKKKQSDLLRHYISLAKIHGETLIKSTERPKRVAVLVNSFANDGVSYTQFEKSALPLLNMAGIKVDIYKPEDSTQLGNMASALDKTEADYILIVGGDGTISKVLSGLINGPNTQPLPLAICPTGRNNYSWKSLVQFFSGRSIVDLEARCLGTMALIEELTPRKVYPFTLVKENSEELEDSTKTLGLLGHVHVGPFQRVDELRWKYWYWDGLRAKFAYFWNSFKAVFCPFDIDIDYQAPCAGCKNCASSKINKSKAPNNQNSDQKSWWTNFLGPNRQTQQNHFQGEFNNIINETCGKIETISANMFEFLIENKQDKNEPTSKLVVNVGPEGVGRWDFITEGWRRDQLGDHLRSSNGYQYSFDASRLFVTPRDSGDSESTIFSLDGEKMHVNNNETLVFEVYPTPFEFFLPS